MASLYSLRFLTLDFNQLTEDTQLGKAMNDSWFDQFKRQIETLRNRKILRNEKGFCRIDNFLLRYVVGFTDVFLTEATKTLDEKVPCNIRKMRRMLLDAFRCALRLSIFDEELNFPRFLISLQEHLRLRQKEVELSNYKLFHSFALETGTNSLINVKCYFVVDFEIPDPIRQRFPFINFSISGSTDIKARIYSPEGREIVDFLDPNLVTQNWFYISNISRTPMISENVEMASVVESNL